MQFPVPSTGKERLKAEAYAAGNRKFATKYGARPAENIIEPCP